MKHNTNECVNVYSECMLETISTAIDHKGEIT